jgi:hypothetical protein
MNSPFDFFALTAAVKAATAKKSKFRSRRTMHALESRIVFDGALVAGLTPDAVKALVPTVNAPVEVVAANAALDGGKHEAVFIDTSTSNWQALVSGLEAKRPGVAIELIDGGQSGLAQIATWAKSNTGYDAIHVMSQGGEATLKLGTDRLTNASLSSLTTQAELKVIGSALNPGGNILLYGSNVAAGSDGQAFMSALSTDTNAVIAASDRAVGDAGHGGTWVLDVSTGTANVQPLAISGYLGTLGFGDKAAANSPASVQIQAANSSLDGGKLEVAFIDTSASGWQTLVSDTQASRPGIEIQLIDGTESGLAQMVAWADTHKGYDAIHILSQGSAGVLKLGTDTLADVSLNNTEVRIDLHVIAGALKSGGEVLLYGQNINVGTDGQTFLTDLSAAAGGTRIVTGTDAAALNIAPADKAGLAGGVTADAILPASNATATQVVVVDSTVVDWRTLIAGMDPTIPVIVLTPNANGMGELAQLASALSNFHNLNSISLVTEGRNGGIILGQEALWNGDLQYAGADIAAIRNALKPGGDLLLYGCSVAGSADGKAFVDNLAANLGNGIVVAASTNKTGPTALGGDWNLEYATGAVSVILPFSLQGMQDISHCLGCTLGATNQTVKVNFLSYTEYDTGTAIINGAGTVVGVNGYCTYYHSVKFLPTQAALTLAIGGTNANTVATSLAAFNTQFSAACAGSAGPTITSATFSESTNLLTVTATGMTTGDTIAVNTLTLTGQGGGTYTLTSANVTATNATTFSLTLNAADQLAVGGLLNQNGLTAISGTTFNLGAAASWDASRTTAADLTGNGVTVSNVASPTVTSATYDASTGTLVVTGTGLVGTIGATNDITVADLTLKGQGGLSYTLTSANVEASSTTGFSVTLNAADKVAVNGLLNKNLTSAIDATVFNIAAIAGWDSALAVADLTANAVTVSNVASPTITSATYNASTGALVVTGTGLVGTVGATNDITVANLTLTGQSGGTYTLTSGNVEVSSATGFTVTLNAADKVAVNGLLNNNGTSALSGTTFNLAAASGWDSALAAADLTLNGVTVSAVASPTVTSATYNASTGVLVVTGTGLVGTPGATNDITVADLTLTGQSGGTYTLTSANVEVTSATAFSVTLNAADLVAVNGLLDKNGLTALSGTTFNLAAATGWNSALAAQDLTLNGVTVSAVASPTVTSATYDGSTGTLVVTGTGFVGTPGAINDITANKFTLSGDSSAYTLTDTANVEVTSATSFTIILSATDKAAITTRLNKNGTSSTGVVTYNISAAAGWDSALAAADTTGNGITASNAGAPSVSSINRSGSQVTNATSETFTVVFSQAVTGVAASNFTAVDGSGVTGNTIGTPTSSDGGITWTVAVSGVAGNGTLGLNLANNISGITAVTGGAALSATHTSDQTFTIDNIPPTLAISSNVSAVKIGETATVTFTFSEAPTGFVVGDITTTGGTLSGFAVTGNPLVYTATFTPTASLASGNASITVASGAYTDAAGNTGGAGTTPAISIDTVAPTLAITSNVSAVKIGETATVTFTFSEAPTGFVAGDITTTGGTLSGFAVTGNPLVYTATFTPTPNQASGNASITVASASYTDAAGNTGGAGATPAISIDTVAPTTPVLALGTGVTGGATSTESTQNTGVVTVSGETGSTIVVTFTNGANTVTKTLTGTGSAQAVTLAAGDLTTLTNGTINVSAVATDAAGNASSAGTSSFVLDTVAPTVAITSNVSAVKSGESATVTFTFSEAPTGFSPVDITVTGGTLSGFAVTGNPLIYTATFTPTPNQASGNASITVASASYTDAAGNPGGAGTTPAISIDTVAPAISTAAINGTQLVLTYTEANALNSGSTLQTAEYVVKVGGSTVTVNSVALDAVNKTVTLTLAASVLSTDTVTVSYTANGTVAQELQDVAGNLAANLTNSAVTNNTPLGPTTTVTAASLSADTGTSATDFITSTASQTISGSVSAALITGEKVQVSYDNGVNWTDATTQPTGSGTTWSSTTTLSGSSTFKARVTDANGSSTAYTHSYILDTANPTVAISSTITTNTGSTGTITSGGLTKDNTLALTGTVSDANGITSVQIYDNTSTLLGTATVVSGNWSYTTSALGEGAHSLTAIATDTAGNTTTTSAVTATVDTIAPVVPTLVLGTGVTGGATSTEAQQAGGVVTVSGETGSTIVVTFTNGSNSVTKTVTGTGSAQAVTLAAGDLTTLTNGTISVSAVSTDAAGNASTAGTTSFILDTVAPVTPTLALGTGVTGGATSTEAQQGSGVVTVSGETGSTIVVTFTNGSNTVTKTVTGTGSAQAVTLAAGDLTSLTNGTISVSAISTDAAGNASSAGTSSFVLDTVVPLAATPVANNLVVPTASTFTFTVAYSDTGVGINSASIAAGNVTVTGPGSIGALTVTGASWNSGTGVATYTVQAPHTGVWNAGTDYGTYTVGINGSSVTDLAGNAVAAASGATTFSVNFTPSTTVTGASLSADTGTSSTDFLTNTAGQTINGTLSANLGTGEFVQVSYDNGANWTNATSYTVGSATWSTTTTLAGSSTFQARVANSGSSSTAYTHSYILDTTLPTETISSTLGTTGGLTGTITSGGLTKANTLALSGTVSDANGIASVQIYDGATLLGAATVTNGNWTYTTGTLADGAHSLTALATDNAANTTTTSAVTATVDTVAPTETISSTLGTTGGLTGTITSGGLTKANTLGLSGTVSDVNGISSVQIYDGVTLLGAATVTNGNWSYTVHVDPEYAEIA